MSRWKQWLAAGRLIKPGAVSTFADALGDYCTDPALRKAHGQAGVAASARYDWDRVNQTLVDTYLRQMRLRQI